MKSHEVDYQIVGDDMQMVQVELDLGETVVAEAGTMTYMEEGISSAYKRKVQEGRSCFIALVFA